MKKARSIKHWTPRYVLNRIKNYYWMQRHQQSPWLNRHAVKFIDQWLQYGDIAVEWGSGRSTLWLARRVSRLISIEHSPYWHDIVAKILKVESLDNVELMLIKAQPKPEDSIKEYCKGFYQNLDDDSIDFVLIDGVLRDRCALTVTKKIAPGGLLVIDDAHHFLPSSSRTPYAIPVNGNCANSIWEQFQISVADWRLIWLSDGVHDTALYFKPANDC